MYNVKTLRFCVLSLFFGILSSGVIFNILLMLFYYYRHKVSLSKVFIVMPILMFLIYPSIENKLSFFQTSSNNGFLLNIILRSNLVSSINDGDIIKFIIYIVILILSIITLFSNSALTRFCAILAIISVVFLEGLGGISFLGILLLDISRRFFFIENKKVRV